MPLKLSGKCDLCQEKIEVQPQDSAVLGLSPHMITLEDIFYGNKKEALVCPECFKRVKKALDNITVEIEDSKKDKLPTD